MPVESAADLACFFDAREFGETVTFTPRDGAPVPGITAVRYTDRGDGSFGSGHSRKTQFELLQSDVPVMPDLEDCITAADGDWFVQSAEPSLSAPAWLVTVEQTGRS